MRMSLGNGLRKGILVWPLGKSITFIQAYLIFTIATAIGCAHCPRILQ